MGYMVQMTFVEPLNWLHQTLGQWFPTGEEFLPGEEFHEFRGGISTL